MGALLLALLALPALFLTARPALAEDWPDIRTIDFTLTDEARHKDLPVRATYPAGTMRHGLALPVIIFSHGAWGSGENYRPLAEYWAHHGYIVLQPTHEDSVSLGQRFLDRSVFRFWDERPADISFLYEQLGRIERRLDRLPGSVDTRNVAMGGHSFGGHTAQLIAGASANTVTGRRSFAEPRFKAVLVISGQGPGGLFDRQSFQSMYGPMMFITGSEDRSPVSDETPDNRRLAFDLAPPGDKFLLWIQGARHNFGGISDGDRRRLLSGPAHPEQVELVEIASTAFFDAFVRGERETLDGLVALRGLPPRAATISLFETR
jgi:predicted dienelactone hydrolase